MPPTKANFGVTLDRESLERIRNAAYWTDGETVSSLMEKGALDLVARLEKERGAPFPLREGDVKTGRPKKATDD